MSSIKFTFEYTTQEDFVLEVSAWHHEAEKGSRDAWGAQLDEDYPAEIEDFEILRAYSICPLTGLEINQVKPELTGELEAELLPVAWEQYECAKDAYYEYEVNY